MSKNLFESFRQSVLHSINRNRKTGVIFGKQYIIDNECVFVNGSYVCCISELL